MRGHFERAGEADPRIVMFQPIVRSNCLGPTSV